MVSCLNRYVFFMAFALYLVLPGCSNDVNQDMKGIAAKINDFVLSKEDFQSQLVRELEYDDTYKTTVDAKKEFLKTIIEKELLTQEAKKRGLDRNEDFIAAIEKYWQSTLIKLLMEEKNQEIKKTISVTQKEVQEMYVLQKNRNPALPSLSEVEAEITRAALAKKRGAVFEKWIQSLRENAEIKINNEFINNE